MTLPETGREATSACRDGGSCMSTRGVVDDLVGTRRPDPVRAALLAVAMT
jgi:hypothetical protein